MLLIDVFSLHGTVHDPPARFGVFSPKLQHAPTTLFCAGHENGWLEIRDIVIRILNIVAICIPNTQATRLCIELHGTRRIPNALDGIFAFKQQKHDTLWHTGLSVRRKILLHIVNKQIASLVRIGVGTRHDFGMSIDEFQRRAKHASSNQVQLSSSQIPRDDATGA